MDILHYLTKELKTCKVLSTVQQSEDEEEWLKARTKGIGGSDVGSICGVNTYSSARLVYFKKTGQFEESTGNFSDTSKERMHFGHMLEPVVADEFARRTGKRIAVSPATLCSAEYPWAIANVDRFILDDEGKPYGILECKTAGEFMKDDWAEADLPISYLYQLNWYMWVCGLKYGALACLVGGNKFYYYEIFFNEELFNTEIFPAVDKFWNYNVKNLIAPEITGSDADTEFVNKINSDVIKNSEKMLEGDVLNELAATIKDGKLKIKELEKIVESATNRIKDELGTTEIGYTADHTIKWSARSQTRVDTDALKANFPEVYEQCKKTITFRAFSVK